MITIDEELNRLNMEVVELYQKKEYSGAIKVATQALEFGEKFLGPKHPNISTTLNNLAVLYEKTGDQDRAAPLRQWNLQLLGNRTLNTQTA